VPVAPLSVEEGSEDASAVDLFVTRADDAGVALDLQADRQTISAICGKVGGLPLAIELAAARTAVVTPHQILDRLTDRLATLQGGQGGPEHHKTIEATIAWSYDLLDPDTQKLLRFLSVFEGGFDLDQAEAVGGTDAARKCQESQFTGDCGRQGVRWSGLWSAFGHARDLTARPLDLDGVCGGAT
jgi:predicted ATPase